MSIYSLQSKDPSRHSWITPARRIIRKKDTPNKISTIRFIYIIRGRGINKAISISKTKKTTARTKKRREKGTRALPLGSNPHSKGDLFSRSLNLFIDKIIPAKRTKNDTNTAKNHLNKLTFIP